MSETPAAPEPASPETLRQQLASTDLGDRLRAVNALRELAPADGFPLLCLAARDANPRVRYAALSQFDTHGTHDRPAAIALLRDRLLNDEEPDVQAAAADSLGALSAAEAFEDLVGLYESTEEWLLQFSIVAALGELGDRRAFDLLSRAIASDNELERIAALSALGDLGDPRAVPLLAAQAGDEDWQVRDRVAKALKRFDTPEARSALETLAADPVEQVAREASSASD